MPTNILMPALSPTMTEGTLAKWLVKEGDTVASGDVIAEIETDKATMEVEAVDEGTIAKILIDEGSEGVAVNAVIAVLVEEGEDPNSVSLSEVSAANGGEGAPASAPATPAPKADPQPEQSAPDDTPAPQATQDDGKGGRIKASPLAKRIAAQNGLDLTQIQGSGPGGRIIKRDVENLDPVILSSEPASVSSGARQLASAAIDGPTPFEVQKPSGVRKIIAKRLSESKFSSPHFYVTMDMEIDALLALRKQINVDPEALKVSVNDMLIMACGRALKAVPEANAGWISENEIHQYARADISVAVALEGSLVTPVVRGADVQSLSQIAAQASDLVGRARDNKLKPEEMQGGSFSISNMGMMGVKHFTAIINPPQGAILAVGAGEKRPVVRGDTLEIATVMTCTLSSDHRVIDGAVAAKLIGKIKSLVENPVQMLV